MSTNSIIKIQRKDGTETSIYCHWDGYIEGVGTTLQLAYNTAEKVEELLKLGDLSSLRYYTEPKEGTHDFEHPQEDVCVAYHRDRGEEFRQSAGMCEYNYTFVEAEAVWYVEAERYVENTKGLAILSMNFYCRYEKQLLIDAIRTADFSGWVDDEFAKSGEVYQECAKKAREARSEIIKKEQEYYDSYYRAYCD